MDGDSERRGRPPPVLCSKSGCGGRANQSCMSLLCSACCRSAGNKCKAHAVRAPPKPKTPESPLHRSQFKASTLTRPPEHEGGSRFGPLRIPDAKAPGTPERESHVFGGEAALVETGNASFGGGGAELEGKPRIRNVDHGGLTDLVHEMSVEGGNGEQVGFFRDEERDKKDPMEVDTESAGLAGATRQGSVALLDNASLRQRANNGASSAVLGTDAQEFERETASVSREEASNRAEDCGEQVGLSPAEMDALWNEEEAEGGSLLTQGTGEGGFSTPNDLLGANTFPNRGLPPLDSGPGLDKKPFGGQQGSVAGQAESPQSSAAEQELFLRISSQRSPFAASARQSPAFLSETPGPGFTQELASAAFASQFGTANSRTGPLPTSGGGADFYRQLAQTLTPRRAAAFASGIDGGLATGEPSRIPWPGPATQLSPLPAPPTASPLTSTGSLLERYHLDLQNSAPLKQAFAFPQLNRDALSLSPSFHSSSAEPSPTSLDRTSGYTNPGARFASPGLELSSPWPLSPLGEALLVQPFASGPLSPGDLRTSSSTELPLRGGRSKNLSIAPPLTYPLGPKSGSLGRGWTGGFGNESPEQTAPAAKRLRLSNEPLTRPATADPLSPPKAKSWERKAASDPLSPAWSRGASSAWSVPPPPASPIPSVPVLASLGPESLPPASIPILVMQLQALRENVPAHLQDQVLASNRPLRILADAIEAHRRANTGAGSGGGKGGVAGTGGSAPHISPGRRKPGGGKKEGSVQKTGTTVIVKKEAGRDERALEGRNGGAGGVSAEPQVGPAHVVKQEGPEGKPTGAGPRTLAGAEREGSKREPLLRGAAKSKGALALPQETVPLGAAFAPPQKLVESGAHKSSSPRNEGCVPQGFELAKDGVKLEEDPIQTETGTLAGDSEKPVKSILPDVILEEAAGMRSGHAEGGAALTFKGLPSVRDSELQWSSAVDRKPELDEGSAVTTEASLVERALDRLRATTQLMQHVLPAPTPAALGGASPQDREISVYVAARDTLQEAATWAAPRGGGEEQPGVEEQGTTQPGGATKGNTKGASQGTVLGVAEEDAGDDEELAARVDDLRRHLQRLEDAPSGVEVLQQILTFDQAQTAGVGLTDEQVQRRATSLQGKTAPGLPTSVGPPEKRKPHKVVTSFSDLV